MFGSIEMSITKCKNKIQISLPFADILSIPNYHILHLSIDLIFTFIQIQIVLIELIIL